MKIKSVFAFANLRRNQSATYATRNLDGYFVQGMTGLPGNSFPGSDEKGLEISEMLHRLQYLIKMRERFLLIEKKLEYPASSAGC